MLFEARRGDLNITITENGELVAKDSQNVSPDIRGRNKIEWLIEEGKLVEEGEVVCRLDTTDLKKEVDQLAKSRGVAYKVIDNLLLLTDVAVSGLSGNNLVQSFNDMAASFGSAATSLAIDRLSKAALEGTVLE